ncbi:MAG TPA: type II secretion system protein [Vicinamibacterales bacterium]|nr:type II secretion system protein [Vicinamibacterales bacterium]
MPSTAPRLVSEERGYLMVALLVAMSIMAITMTAILPAWSTMARREREAELVFRGEQYARAIRLFQQKFGGAFPPNVDALVDERVLRKKYKDPITNDDFQPIAVGDATAGPSAQNPFAPTGTGTGRASTPGTGRGTPASATPGRQTPAPPQPSPAGQRAGGFGTGQTQGGRPGGAGLSGSGTGIMGVTSKSEAPSLRIYKGGDHYNQWLFIATQAQTQAGGRGAQTPGQGTRGGAPGPTGRPGGVGPRGSSPFGGGSGPGGGAPGPGRGRF